MDIKNRTVCNEKVAVWTNEIIPIEKDNNACLETEEQFAISHAQYLPGNWLEDYYEVFKMRYQQYMNMVHYDVINHKSSIKLHCADMDDTCINKILITFQTTYFTGTVELVISDSNHNEISIFSLNDLGWHPPYARKFVDNQIDLIELNEKFEDLFLTTGQTLTLQTTGGVLLTGNIMLSTRTISGN